MKTSLFLLTASLLFSWSIAVSAQEKDATALLAEAMIKQKSIGVLYHGSDWNRASETFKSKIWDSEKLRKNFEPKMIFTHIDTLDMYPTILAKQMKQICEGKMTPASVAIETPTADQQGVTFSSTGNRTFAVGGENPAKVTYRLSFTPETAMETPLIALRIQKDPLKQLRGRSDNGNFCMTEAKLTETSGTPLPFASAWANAANGNENADCTIDGDIGDRNYWCVNTGNIFGEAVLVLAPKDPLIRGKKYILELLFQSAHPNHSIAHFSMDLYDFPSAEETLKIITQNRIHRQKMKSLETGIEAYPAVVLYDDRGRIFAKMNSISLMCHQSEAEFTRILNKAFEAKRQRDLAFESAKKAQGAAQARGFARGLIALEAFLSGGEIKNIYKEQFEAMKKADPKDQSGYIRRLSFAPGSLTHELLKLAQESKFAEGEQKLNEALRLPQNAVLTPEQKQELYLAGYLFYRDCKGKEAEKWDMLRQGAKLAPESHIGLGMRGTLSMWGEGEVGIPYGWFPKDCKTPTVDWKITMGCKRFFDHAGRYLFIIQHQGGKNGMNVQSVTLTVNGKTVSSCQQAQTLSPAQPTLEIPLEMTEDPSPNAVIQLNIQGAPIGGENSKASFRVKPLL